MKSSIHNSLSIRIFDTAKEAIDEGFVYREPAVKPIKVLTAVVVRKGTVAGNPTVDFLLEDETGQRFVFLITGNLLKTIPC